MRASVCVTTFNEERSIAGLLDSLLNQTKKPDEIILVDAGSTDQTVPIIRHYQKKDSKIKLLITDGASRAKGRNLSVELSENEVVAMTDAGCVARPKWFENIIRPFDNEKVGLVAGFYKMVGDTPLQKAFSVFLGTLPGAFDANFLPSTRSLAFRKSLFEDIGGFTETQKDTAEDTVFNYNAVSLGLKFTRVKNARVEWEMPKTLKEGILKMYKYAMGDAKSGIWYHPVKGIMSHNVKAISKMFRFIVGVLFFILGFSFPPFFFLLFVILVLYGLWAFRKVYLEYRDYKAGLWGVVIQFASDIAVMLGFVRGLLIR